MCTNIKMSSTVLSLEPNKEVSKYLITFGIKISFYDPILIHHAHCAFEPNKKVSKYYPQIREQMSGPDLHVLTLKFLALKKPALFHL